MSHVTSVLPNWNWILKHLIAFIFDISGCKKGVCYESLAVYGMRDIHSLIHWKQHQKQFIIRAVFHWSIVTTFFGRIVNGRFPFYLPEPKLIVIQNECVKTPAHLIIASTFLCEW